MSIEIIRDKDAELGLYRQAKLGFGRLEYRMRDLLVSLLDEDGTVTVIQSDLAKELNISRQTACVAISRLKKYGIIERIGSKNRRPIYRFNKSFIKVK